MKTQLPRSQKSQNYRIGSITTMKEADLVIQKYSIHVDKVLVTILTDATVLAHQCNQS